MFHIIFYYDIFDIAMINIVFAVCVSRVSRVSRVCIVYFVKMNFENRWDLATDAMFA